MFVNGAILLDDVGEELRGVGDGARELAEKVQVTLGDDLLVDWIHPLVEQVQVVRVRDHQCLLKGRLEQGHELEQ